MLRFAFRHRAESSVLQICRALYCVKCKSVPPPRAKGHTRMQVVSSLIKTGLAVFNTQVIQCENPRTFARQGGFAAFGASGGTSSSFSKTGEAAATRLEVCAHDLPTTLKAAHTPPSTARDRAMVSTAVRMACRNSAVEMGGTNPTQEHDDAEGEKETRECPLCPTPACRSYCFGGYHFPELAEMEARTSYLVACFDVLQSCSPDEYVVLLPRCGRS